MPGGFTVFSPEDDDDLPLWERHFGPREYGTALAAARRFTGRTREAVYKRAQRNSIVHHGRHDGWLWRRPGGKTYRSCSLRPKTDDFVLQNGHYIVINTFNTKLVQSNRLVMRARDRFDVETMEWIAEACKRKQSPTTPRLPSDPIPPPARWHPSDEQERRGR